MVNPLKVFKIIRIALKTGTVTCRYPYTKPLVTSEFRGRILIDPNKCRGCGLCSRVCPTKALTFTIERGGRRVLSYFAGQCIFCGLCIEACRFNAISFTQDFELATNSLDDLQQIIVHEPPKPQVKVEPSRSVESEVAPLNPLPKHLGRSIWVFHLNTGSCNACDIEVLDVLTSYHDVERFGIKLVASPRHADVALLTGPVTYESLPKVVNAISAMPRPRAILALGTCAIGGNVWYDSYTVLGGVQNLLKLLAELNIPVDRVLYVPGCPVRPESIIHGIGLLIGLIEKKVKKRVFVKTPQIPLPRKPK
ncbi:MAG TPA: 4Fe-4S dicluster domain-containing protein [Desulfurococcales archaeon]|nr:4Fe-4S dicluster domain-containing protein [Desulfurococcales archaeon]